MYFHELMENEKYDGIWACSSILHLPVSDLADVMKKMQKIAWVVLLVQLAIVIYSVISFKVDDVTLSRGEITSFNENWTIIREDGTKDSITLPMIVTIDTVFAVF